MDYSKRLKIVKAAQANPNLRKRVINILKGASGDAWWVMYRVRLARRDATGDGGWKTTILKETPPKKERYNDPLEVSAKLIKMGRNFNEFSIEKEGRGVRFLRGVKVLKRTPLSVIESMVEYRISKSGFNPEDDVLLDRALNSVIHRGILNPYPRRLPKSPTSEAFPWYVVHDISRNVATYNEGAVEKFVSESHGNKTEETSLKGVWHEILKRGAQFFLSIERGPTNRNPKSFVIRGTQEIRERHKDTTLDLYLLVTRRIRISMSDIRILLVLMKRHNNALVRSMAFSLKKRQEEEALKKEPSKQPLKPEQYADVVDVRNVGKPQKRTPEELESLVQRWKSKGHAINRVDPTEAASKAGIERMREYRDEGLVAPRRESKPPSGEERRKRQFESLGW